ncbi:hypothetical protein EF294_03640 [Gordonia oryzae]|uniref:Uncharacterized protein n=1 Tax=Gordonia oryzae TaxID=2487349 RepID=A0A3N4GSQ2_9ACTN|nr:hypothetical protein [Gordonia oryzae]RPA65842.1 hypothetical protein EF294_03640 [Gordonia oryzae]
MIMLLIIFAVVAGLLAVLFLVGFVASLCDEADRHAEIARVNRERRLAEARINRLTTTAIQQMAEAAAPHSIVCQCTRCVGRGGVQ